MVIQVIHSAGSYIPTVIIISIIIVIATGIGLWPLAHHKRTLDDAAVRWCAPSPPFAAAGRVSRKQVVDPFPVRHHENILRQIPFQSCLATGPGKSFALSTKANALRILRQDADIGTELL